MGISALGILPERCLIKTMDEDHPSEQDLETIRKWDCVKRPRGSAGFHLALLGTTRMVQKVGQEIRQSPAIDGRLVGKRGRHRRHALKHVLFLLVAKEHSRRPLLVQHQTHQLVEAAGFPQDATSPTEHPYHAPLFVST